MLGRQLHGTGYAKSGLRVPMAEELLETRWYAKLHFSLEGSLGGIGTSDGGGCGCYRGRSGS